MKIEQQKQEFAPITITLETEKEATLFWELIEQGRKSTELYAARNIGIDICNWLKDCEEL